MDTIKKQTDYDCDAFSTGLISAEQALSQLLDAAKPLSTTEKINTANAINRVLADDYQSNVNVPPLNNSAMDGYTLAAADSHDGENALPLSQRICAGEMGTALEAKTVARIFTGAPIPEGADAVIMQEQVTIKNDLICFNGVVTKGKNVRTAGEDIAIKQTILTQGTRLRSQEMGLAASIGLAELNVFRKLRVGVFFTGNELTEPGNPLAPGKIYDSNRYTLHGLLTDIGCEIVDLGIVEDTLEATKAALQDASTKADLVITSGGVSVGEEDHVRIALEALGELSMWRIAMKPGKPLAFGNVNDTPFIGLPGNPVSVFATFHLFAAPFIKKMQGMSKIIPIAIPLIAGFDFPKAGKRQEYLRARLNTQNNGQTVVEVFPHQGSGVLTSTSWADGFVVVPIDTIIAKGDQVQYLPFSDLL